MKLKDKIVIISGASSGIGSACAHAFAEAGAKPILIARRRNRLEQLAARLKEEFGTQSYILECDVRNYQALERAFSSLPAEWRPFDILINNAGLARGIEKLQEADTRDWDEMIDTNIKGMLYLSKLVLPSMVARSSGTVINIGSTAGYDVYPGGSVYCGTKFALRAISKGMTIDCNGTGVRVTYLAPGFTETEFAEVRFRGDQERAKKTYLGFKPLSGSDIAEITLFVATLPDHVMIHELLVTPTDQATVSIVNRKQ